MEIWRKIEYVFTRASARNRKPRTGTAFWTATKLLNIFRKQAGIFIRIYCALRKRFEALVLFTTTRGDIGCDVVVNSVRHAVLEIDWKCQLRFPKIK